MAKKPETSSRIADNKKAAYNYFFEERHEAGMVLHGWEVKALREERKAHDQVIVQGTVAVAEEHARRIVDGVGSAVQQGIYQASISKGAAYK